MKRVSTVNLSWLGRAAVLGFFLAMPQGWDFQGASQEGAGITNVTQSAPKLSDRTATGEYDPYMHVFLDAGNGNVLAFFELPQQKQMGRDENTPLWVQHTA